MHCCERYCERVALAYYGEASAIDPVIVTVLYQVLLDLLEGCLENRNTVVERVKTINRMAEARAMWAIRQNMREQGMPRRRADVRWLYDQMVSEAKELEDKELYEMHDELSYLSA